MVNKMNVLLIHVSNKSQKFPEDIQYIPNGLFSIANELKKKNNHVEILHLGLEEMDPNFSILDYISLNNIDFVGLTLHWVYQTYPVIKLAQNIKKQFKDIKIILGGLSASYFSSVIMRDLKFIDYIIKGSGEKPFIELIESINLIKYPKNIPNLVFRDKSGIVIENEVNYFLNDTNIIDTCHTNLSLLKNWTSYLKDVANYFTYFKGLEDKFYFPYFTFYGKCKKNCGFCGGSIYSKKDFSHNFNFPLKKISMDLENLYNNYGVKSISLCTLEYNQLIDILNELNNKNLNFDHFIELCCGLIIDNNKLDYMVSLIKNKYFISLNLPLNFLDEKSIDKIKTFINHSLLNNYNTGIVLAISPKFIPEKKILTKFYNILETYKNYKFSYCKLVPDPGSYDFEQVLNLGPESILKYFNETKKQNNFFNDYSDPKILKVVSEFSKRIDIPKKVKYEN